MFTQITAKTKQQKVITEAGTTPSQALLQASLKELDIEDPQEFKDYLDNLTPYQTISYGLFKSNTLNKEHRRSLKNIKGINNPWIAFDGDYIINNEHELTMEKLAELDPQLANCKYVQRNSSSNVVGSNNTHKKKIWVQFKTTDQAEIKEYIRILFTKAVIKGWGEFIISQSPNSYAVFQRTIFDTAVFSPERIWNETHPDVASPLQHNTHSEAHDGNMVDPTAIHISAPEMAMYYESREAARRRVQPQIEERKQSMPASQRKKLEEAERQVLTTTLITSDKTPIQVIEVIKQHLNIGEIPAVDFAALSYRDPMDPDYGSDKAKLFFNETDVYLHSFAHGSTTYRLAIDINQLWEVYEPPATTAGKKMDPKIKMKHLNRLKQIIPYLYVQDQDDIEYIISELTAITSKPALKSLFAHAIYEHERLVDKSELMLPYALYNKKKAPWVTFDADEGINFIDRDALPAIMDNKIKGVTGKTICDTHQKSTDRKDVNGFGMYIDDPIDKLNLWAGFNAYELPQIITEEDIQPYLDLSKLVTGDDPELTKAFMVWRADLVQNPLRADGGRPGFAVKGDKGAGKSFEHELLQSFFYKFNTLTVKSMDELVGNFNAPLASTVLIVAEELHMDNTKVAGAKDAMKSILTSGQLRVEPKGIDPTQVPNHLHILLSTNHAQAVIQDSDDRRWTIATISNKHRKDKAYFGAVHRWWHKEGGKNKVFTYFMNYEYKLTDAFEGVLTKVGKEERVSSFYGVDAYVFEILHKAVKGMTESATTWYDLYTVWFEETYPNKSYYGTVRKFGAELTGQGILSKRSNRWTLDIENGRRAFEAKFFDGELHEWEEGAE